MMTKFLIFLIVSLFICKITGTTIYTHDYIDTIYGYGPTACEYINPPLMYQIFNLGGQIIFEDANTITNFKVINPGISIDISMVKTALPKQLYKFILSTGYGNHTVSINVTNSLNQVSTLTLPKPFICSYLPNPMPISIERASLSFSQLLSQFLGYLYLDVPSNLIAMTCSSPSAAFSAGTSPCGVVMSSTLSNDVYQIYLTPDYRLLNNLTIEINFEDGLGNSTKLSFPNPFFQQNTDISTVSDVFICPGNNTLYRNTYDYSNAVIQIEYNNLNGILPVKIFSQDYFNGRPLTGNVILGTFSNPTYSFLASVLYNNSYNNFYTLSNTAKHSQYEGNELMVTFLATNNLVTNFLIGSTSVSKIINSVNLISSNFTINNLRFNIRNNYQGSASIPLEFPYGLKTINSTSWSYKSNIFYPPYNNTFYFYSYYSDYFGYSKELNTSGIVDTQPPQIQEIITILLDNNNFVIKMRITDDVSGLKSISIMNPSTKVYYAYELLVDGTTLNGTYEIMASVSNLIYKYLIIAVVDMNGNDAYITKPSDFDLQPTPLPISKQYTINDIIDFYFEYNEVDTSFIVNPNKAFLKVANPDQNLFPSLYLYQLNQFSSNPEQFQGYYDPVSTYYIIPFTIPQRRFYSELTFTITFPPLYLENSLLFNKFGSKAICVVKSNYADNYPPMVTSLTPIPSQSVSSDTLENKEIGWSITISDFPTGLKNGILVIGSTYDSVFKTFEFTPDDCQNGDFIQCTYEFTFSIEDVQRSSNFYIKQLTLYDLIGTQSVYPTTDSQTSPFLTILDTIGNNRTIEYTNTIPVTDTQLPQLVSLQFDSELNSFTLDRELVINFTTRDYGEAGISLNHNPVVFAQHYFGSISIQSEFLGDNNGVYSYQAKTKVNYGYSYYGLYISVHGITDNQNNVNSYTVSDLISLNMDYYIKGVGTPLPIIESTNSITKAGGDFRIFGMKFGTSVGNFKAFINLGGNSFSQVSPLVFSSIACTFNLSSITSDSFRFYVEVSGERSNEIVVQVQPLPSVPDCSKLNNCNNQGTCTFSGCSCSSGWQGISCDFAIKKNQSVITNLSDPVINFSDNVIYFKEVNEYDFQDNLVAKHPIPKWDVTVYNQTEYTRYSYSTFLTTNSLSPNFTVVVDFYKADSSISFAGNTQTISKDTVKFTIFIGTYKFQSQLNKLGITMAVSTSSSVDDNGCSSNNYGITNGNEIEWLKLRIGDSSLYGKFLSVAEIDYRIVSIKNILISNQTNPIEIQTLIPFYHNNVILDPDFSVLLETDPIEVDGVNVCSQIKSEDNSKKWKTIVIAVVVSVAGVAILGSLIYYVIVKRKDLIFRKKLKSLSNNEN